MHVPRTETVLKVFVASPSDVADERACLEEVVRELNLIWSKQLGIRLDLVKWETHAFPGVGDDSQAVINEQIDDDYDFFIGIMWKRAGTPTNRAVSGTIEEFQRAFDRFIKNPNDVKIMFYFNDTPVALSEIDPIQLKTISDFKRSLGERGTLYWTYTGREEFASLLRIHLSRQVQDWQKNYSARTVSVIDLSEANTEQSIDNLVEEEEGLIDLIELGQENIEIMTESVDRMVQAIKEVGEKMSERSSEIDRVNSSKVPDYKATKKIVNRASEDMNQFVARMEPELPIFRDSYSKAIDAMIGVSSLRNDFESGDEQKVEQDLLQVIELRDTMKCSLDGTKSFRDVISSLPRISTDFNRSKRGTLKILDALIDEMTQSVNLISELEKNLKE